MQIPDTNVAEIMGRAGFDWVAIDLEHGPVAPADLPDMFRALEIGGTLPFARVAENRSKDIKQVLDSGACGIIIPMIETKEQMEYGIESAKFPPDGKRGIGFSRANLFGKEFKEYFEKINQEIAVIAQIENINAVRELDKILSVKNLDGIMVGPYDLSGSMGLTGNFSHPEFQKVLTEIKEKAAAHEIPMGLHIVEPDENILRKKIKEGYLWIAYGIDAVFLNRSSLCPKIL